MFTRLARLGFLLRFTALIVLASAGNAQNPVAAPLKIKLGGPSVDGSLLKPYKNAWKVVYAFPGKEPFLWECGRMN